MRVLHICNDFSHTKVHHNLYSELDKVGIEQLIFNPLRDTSHIGNNSICFLENKSQIYYSRPLKYYHRFFFRLKKKWLVKDLKRKITNFKKIDLIHATTLFSDGAVAYEIHKEYKIPYIVAVRNTDIFTFLKYRPDLFFLARKILKNASRIIFISRSSLKNFSNHYFVKTFIEKISPNFLVVNNGINKYWIENRKSFQKVKPRKILFIGRFDRNKNVLRLIKAFNNLEQNKEFSLTLVGGKGGYHKQVLGKINSKKNIEYLGYISDREKLAKIFDENHIFAMASIHETFGLVYLEALSQGLPILYTKNEGLSDTFSIKIGEGVDPMEVSDIYGGLKKIIDNYYSYDLNKINFNRFHWSNIADRYKEIYNDAVTN